MKLELRNKPVFVQWHYDKAIIDENERRTTVYLGGTTCKITIGEGEDAEEITSTIKRHHKDPFKKNTARKISLKKALDIGVHAIQITKEEKKLFWQAYFALRGHF